MTDTPKRRGRPPKDRPSEMAHEMRAIVADTAAHRTAGLRIRAGQVQQAWLHAAGIEWRPLPVVPDNAPDWEDTV